MPGHVCSRGHAASESLSAHELVHTKCTFRARNICSSTWLLQQELVQLPFVKPKCRSAWKHTKNRRDMIYYARHTHTVALATHCLSNDANETFSPALKTSEVDGLENDIADANRGKESVIVKLRRYGVAGMLSYGLLNTVYYLGMFLFAWFYISPAPSGLGYRAAAERFIKLFALVWAGSQVTKLLRAGCALALAPIMDKGLKWLTDNSRFRSRAEVFGVVVTFCLGLALTVFLIITLLWA
ncbi:hypothetical protein L7F22_063220 [Adiantum nelumboides]|nr:hypothetical protein [Adiantum nelumboides]